MDEEKKEKKVKDTPEEILAKTEMAASRLEAGNAELVKLLAQRDSVEVEATLDGEADAGKQEKSKEQIAIDSAKQYLEGTGLENEAFPDKE